MISVVTFKWRPKPGYRSHFMPGHVNVMRNMVERHYKRPHRFICITDDATGLDPRIEVIPLWNDHAEVPNPTWPDGPSCYRRLKLWSREMHALLGPRFVCLDLDAVIVDDVTPLWDRREDFLIFKTHLKHIPLCGSMFAMNTGTQSFVWDAFDPTTSPALATARGCRGSDQGWLTYCYGADVPGWTNSDGVYSYMEIAPRRPPSHRRRGAPPIVPGSGPLPKNARIVFFTGKPDPWDHEAKTQSPWINEHYR